MKKILFTLALFFLFTNVNALELDIQSKNAIMYNTKENKIIYEKNKDEKIKIASMTKIMTAIVVLENIKDLNEKVVLSNEDFEGLLEENLVTAGFKPNQTVTYTDLLYGLLLPSGADAAKALARLTAKNEENFVKLMNDKAKKLKLKNTHFANPIGLDDENNYSTVSDVYKLFSYALKNSDFKRIITSKNYQTSDGTLNLSSTVVQNRNVGNYLLGGKTGTTDGAGLCLASIASFDNTDFILVTAGAPYDKKGAHHLEDAKLIYEYVKDNFDYQTIIDKKDVVLTLKTKYVKKDKIKFYANKKINKYVLNKFDKDSLTYKYNGKKQVTSKMKKGDKLGTLDIYYDDEKIDTIDIILNENPEFDFIKYFKDHLEIPVAFIVIVMLGIVIVFKRRK